MSITDLKAKVGMDPLGTKRQEKIETRTALRSMPRRRSPPVGDEAVHKKLTGGQAGVMWESVVEKGWRGMGENEDGIMAVDECVGYKTKRKVIRWK